MNPSTRQALELLRQESEVGPSAAEEAAVRARLERSLGVALPVAVAAPFVSAASSAQLMGGVGKAALGLTPAKLLVVAATSVALGSVGTYLAKGWLASPARSTQASVPRQGASLERGAVSEPLAVPPVVGRPAPVDAPRPDSDEVTVAPAGAVERVDVDLTVPSVPVRAVDRPAVLPTHPAVPARAAVERPVAASASSGAPEPGSAVSAPPLVESELSAADQLARRCSPAGERLALAEAQRAYDARDLTQALAVLDQHHSECRTGEWSLAGWQLRIKALCGLGRASEAKTFFDWYHAEHFADAKRSRFELSESCPEGLLGPR